MERKWSEIRVPGATQPQLTPSFAYTLKQTHETISALPCHDSKIQCYAHSSKLSRTHFRTCFLNSAVFSRHNLAASGFAGDSSLGLESMEMTESKMVSGVWTGDQRSAADS
jgi:hypothetical protein